MRCGSTASRSRGSSAERVRAEIDAVLALWRAVFGSDRPQRTAGAGAR